jgi:hypothetical protein
MAYSCEHCEYDTLIKCNYEKHLLTQAHATILAKLKECEEATLKEHEKVDLKNDEIIDILKNQVEEKDQLIRELTDLLKHHGIATITNSNNINSNNNISVNAYVNAYFNEAPPIKQLTKRDINLIEKECEEEYDNTMVRLIVDLYKNNQLVEFISNIIVKYYKKDDESKQSLWTSDASRLTYVVREIIEKCGVTSWNKDINGEKIRKYTIVPILGVIKKKLYKYRGEVIDKRKLSNNIGRELDDFLETCTLVSELLEMCENKELENQIIKTMTPHFSLNISDNKKTTKRKAIEYKPDNKKTLIMCNHCLKEFKTRHNLQRHDIICRKK